MATFSADIREGIEIEQHSTATRTVRVRIQGSRSAIVITSEKVDSDPWQPPSVSFPASRITYDQWQDLSRAIEKGFAEYTEKFETEPPVLLVSGDE
jgi:hypothetical protein